MVYQIRVLAFHCTGSSRSILWLRQTLQPLAQSLVLLAVNMPSTFCTVTCKPCQLLFLSAADMPNGFLYCDLQILPQVQSCQLNVYAWYLLVSDKCSFFRQSICASMLPEKDEQSCWLEPISAVFCPPPTTHHEVQKIYQSWRLAPGACSSTAEYHRATGLHADSAPSTAFCKGHTQALMLPPTTSDHLLLILLWIPVQGLLLQRKVLHNRHQPPRYHAYPCI